MAKRKKKNKVIPLVCMLVAVVALVGGYFYIESLGLNDEPVNEITNPANPNDGTGDSSVVAIQSKDVSTLVSITFTDKNGDPLTLVKEESIWYIESDKAFPVMQSEIENITATFGTILATRTLDGDSGEFGFDEPQSVFSAKYDEDGKIVEVKYTVGDTNDFNSGTYIRDDISGKVYISSSNPTENFQIEKNDLIELDVAAADVEPLTTKKVTVISADGRTNVITDDPGIEEFLGDPFTNVDCADWVEYDCDDTDMAKYGITKKEDSSGVVLEYKTTVSVTDESGESTPTRTDTTYNIWFGDILDDGSVYYTITGSKFVYKLAGDRYDAVMDYLDYVPASGSAEETTPVTE